MRSRIRTFLRASEGALSVEAVLIGPVLLWLIAATTVFWDAYKTKTVADRSAYTLADMISREAEIDADYLDALYEIYEFLSYTPDDKSFRVSVVGAFENGAAAPRVKLVWSEGVGGMEKRNGIGPLKQRLPEMVAGEQLIVVEALQTWTPPFSIGIGTLNFGEIAVVRPRFAPTLAWVDD